MTPKPERGAITVVSICVIVAVLILIVDMHLSRVLLARAKELSDSIREVENAFERGLGGSDFRYGDVSAPMVRDPEMEARSSGFASPGFSAESIAAHVTEAD